MEEGRSGLMGHTCNVCSMMLLVVSPSNRSMIGLPFHGHKMAAPFPV